jgi:hypothetical protein
MRKGVVIGGGGVDENLFKRDIAWIDGVKGVEPIVTARLIESECEQIFDDERDIPANVVDGVDESFLGGGLCGSG